MYTSNYPSLIITRRHRRPQSRFRCRLSRESVVFQKRAQLVHLLEFLEHSQPVVVWLVDVLVGGPVGMPMPFLKVLRVGPVFHPRQPSTVCVSQKTWGAGEGGGGGFKSLGCCAKALDSKGRHAVTCHVGGKTIGPGDQPFCVPLCLVWSSACRCRQTY